MIAVMASGFTGLVLIIGFEIDFASEAAFGQSMS
jgi:hypothetical protein